MVNVEYAFEPTGLLSIFNRIDELEGATFLGFYSEYLFQEILWNALAGRNLNFNSKDWSCIFHAKSLEEIRSRFDQSSRGTSIYDVAAQYTVAYKLPDILHRVPQLKTMLPSTKVVACIRNPDDVVNSVLLRGWFHGNNLGFQKTGPLRLEDGLKVPAYLNGISAKDWMALSEEDRGYACYVGTYNESFLTADTVVIDYEKLLSTPAQVCADFARLLGLQYGNRTTDLLKGIRPQGTPKTSLTSSGFWRSTAHARYESIRARAV
jgi:hypothetical protein